MFRRVPVAAIVVLALVSSAAAVGTAAARTDEPLAAHKLVVAVKRNLAPAAEKKLAVLVLVRQNGGAPAGALATPSKPLVVLLGNSGLYRVTVTIDAPCRGTCAASYRVSGSAGHKLEVVPSCRPNGRGFVCSTVRLVKVY